MLNRGQLLAWALVGVLLALLAGGGTGYHLGTARGDARVATLQSEFDQAKLKAVASAVADRKREQARADKLAGELASTQADLQTAHINQSRKVPHVTTVYVPVQASTPVAIPPTVFSVGFARLWDDANGLGVPATGQTACSMDGETPASETVTEACLRDSGLGQADLLNNHIDNAARCRVIEATLDKYIQWHRGLP